MSKTIFMRAKNLQEEIDACSGVLTRKDEKKQSPVDVFDQLVTDNALRKIVEKLFREGHHARAVEEAYKFIDNLVKRTAKQGDTNLTGSKLMTTVFNGAAPILRINAGESASERDEQIGYMQIFFPHEQSSSPFSHKRRGRLSAAWECRPGFYRCDPPAYR